MGEFTSICWSTATLNLWWGCTFIEGDPACAPLEGCAGDECYAKTWSERVGFSETGSQFPIWGAHTSRRFASEHYLNEPFRWNRAAEKEGTRRRVFCMSMGDWAEGRPDQKPYLERLWDTVPRTPWLDYLMLTKRANLISKLCPLGALPNVWHGVTAVTQKWFDLRWAFLREVESSIYWISAEPLYERIRLADDFLALGPRAWLICGGQSGRHPFLMDVEWARYMRDQCREAGVIFHMKQMSGRTKAEREAIPEDLMVRGVPVVGQ